MSFKSFLCFPCRSAGKAETPGHVRCLSRDAVRTLRPPVSVIDLDDLNPLQLDDCTKFDPVKERTP